MSAISACRRTRVGLMDSLRVLRAVRSNRTLVSMIVLAGLGSFFVGTSLQTSMPIFAQRPRGRTRGYRVRRAAVRQRGRRRDRRRLLEVTGRIRPTVRAAVVSTGFYGVTSVFFALTSSYPLAVALLLVGGIANLASMSITQTSRPAARPAGRSRPCRRPVRRVRQRPAGRQRVHGRTCSVPLSASTRRSRSAPPRCAPAPSSRPSTRCAASAAPRTSPARARPGQVTRRPAWRTGTSRITLRV